MLRGTLGSKILGVEGEIHLKAKLEQAEKIHYEELKRTGHVYEYTSEIFASVEKIMKISARNFTSLLIEKMFLGIS